MLFSPEELNGWIRECVKLIVFIFAGSIGNFSRQMISRENSGKENVGLAIFSGALAFGIDYYFLCGDSSFAYVFLLCFGVGFFTPIFKNWLISKKPLLVFIRVWNIASNFKQVFFEEVQRELEEKEEEEEEEEEELD